MEKINSERPSIIDEESSSPSAETSPQTSIMFSAVNNKTDEKRYVIEGIKNLMALSRRAKLNERENEFLRSENQALREENEALMKEISTKTVSSEDMILNSKIEELEIIGMPPDPIESEKERILLLRDIEILRERVKELENAQTDVNRSECGTQVEVQEVLASNTLETPDIYFLKETEAIKTSDVPSRTEESNFVHERPTAEFQKNNLMPQMESRKKEVAARHDTSKEEQETVVILIKSLEIEQEKYQYALEVIRTLEEEALEIKKLRKQVENLKKEKTSNPDDTRLRNEIGTLIKNMEEFSEGRRFEDLPESFRFEPPPYYYSSDTFSRTVDILKTILKGGRFPNNMINDFWRSLIRRAEQIEHVIRDKTENAKKLAGDEIIRLNDIHAKEKNTFRVNLQLTEKRLSYAIQELEEYKKTANSSVQSEPDSLKTTASTNQSTVIDQTRLEKLPKSSPMAGFIQNNPSVPVDKGWVMNRFIRGPKNTPH
ncbi:Protein CBG23141 [Caenorhabditis briggsae]|uniref:Protein CBG23141 n=1 Tax=Caenorhabditis briggsae TaxID=6238 RepID=A8Y4L8_CAEBR|nr:Protein CBG23141 [Caenorhabditis briggsae]CAP39838.1 Protein CBG23141 [Caenorhabditis briggsae]